MSTLPDPTILARLISNVTHAMCGTTFVPGDPLERGESLCGQMAMIPLKGQRNFTVVVASDSRGSRALGCAFFGVADAALTPDLISDAISELLNMVAGQITSMLHLDLELGLPRQTTLAELIASGGDGIADATLFRSEGKVDLWLWVFENHVSSAAATAPKKSIFRSILKRLRTSTSA
jgi:hypothetical protein